MSDGTLRCLPTPLTRINSREEEEQEEDFKIVEVDSLHTQRRGSARSWDLSDRQDLDDLSSEDPTKPELTDQSSLLHIGQLCQLYEHLPARLEQCPWSLVYSTQRHGTSLGTLYKSMGGMDCSTSTLTVIRDNYGQVFGAFCPTTLRISLSYYGTGHTFLFSFSPQLQVYEWKFSNSFFVKGSPDYLAFDDGLIHGRSQRCDTFDNDVLSSSDDFLINDLEGAALALSLSSCSSAGEEMRLEKVDVTAALPHPVPPSPPVPAPKPSSALPRSSSSMEPHGQKAPLPLDGGPLLGVPPLVLCVHGEEAQHYQVEEGSYHCQPHQDVHEAEGHIGRLLLEVLLLLQGHKVPIPNGGECDKAVVVGMEEGPGLVVGEGCCPNTQGADAGQEAHQDHVLHGHLSPP
ncbi:unnamed protein product [Coregonus sp. 'balchen']|nr:unnamed protein product [Coregonus sp. 'balchen']